MKSFFLAIALIAIGGTLSGCMGMGMGVATTGGQITYIDPCAIAYDQNGRAYTPLSCQGRFNQRLMGNNFGGRVRGNQYTNWQPPVRDSYNNPHPNRGRDVVQSPPQRPYARPPRTGNSINNAGSNPPRNVTGQQTGVQNNQPGRQYARPPRAPR